MGKMQEAIDKNGNINRKKLAEIVFNDEEKLEILNKLVHPLVKRDFENWVESHKSYPYVLKEAAILFESGANKQCDLVIAVISPLELRIERIRQRDKKPTNIRHAIRSHTQNWCPWRESDPRPLPYQGSALPLSHKGKKTKQHPDADKQDLERETGIEPASLAWKARVLPLNYSRIDRMATPMRARPEINAWIPFPKHPCLSALSNFLLVEEAGFEPA